MRLNKLSDFVQAFHVTLFARRDVRDLAPPVWISSIGFLIRLFDAYFLK